ncbi:MAG: pyridoxal-phosphate dependent enzyme [Lachnospiraceae bacterium]|nr:pyridoxal-phosphate dependent enzyme [Lachnospiraceae bacterium]
MLNYICSKCKKTEPVTTRKARCDCGGLWKLDYTAPKFDEALIDRDTWSMFRYRAFLPLEDDTWKDVSLGEGMTPVIALDEDVLLKMDYFMPTLSFKDRGAAVLISHCKSIGVNSVVQDSSGNAGNSVAAYCGRCGIECGIFVPEGTSPKKIDMIKAHGATVHVIPGSRDHCADVCREMMEKEGKYYANHVYNPFFYQGTKTYIYEVYEQLHRIPEHLFIPVGNGTLFIGAILGLEELLAGGAIDHMPRITGIQSERCAPLARAHAHKSKKPEAVQPSSTLAEGIAIGVPMRGGEILEKAYRYDIDFIEIPEERILDARALLARKGIYCEHTTAANYAAYLKYCELHGRTRDSLLTMCGAGLKSDH